MAERVRCHGVGANGSDRTGFAGVALGPRYVVPYDFRWLHVSKLNGAGDLRSRPSTLEVLCITRGHGRAELARLVTTRSQLENH